jgi:hypothetical protein
VDASTSEQDGARQSRAGIVVGDKDRCPEWSMAVVLKTDPADPRNLRISL